MSDERTPDIVFLKRLPGNPGKKLPKNSLKIELFHVAQFQNTWSLDIKDKFLPAVPLRKDDSRNFWRSGLYRVRVKGIWVSGGCRWTFFTKEQIHGLWLDF